MALQDRIARRRQETQRNYGIYYNADGTPKTVVTTSKISNRGFGDQGRSEKKLRDYWKYYKGDDMVFAAVNIIAFNTVMCGYTLISENEKAKELIQTNFDRMDIDGVLIDNVIYGLVVGDSYIEKVRGRLNDNTTKSNKQYTVSLKTASPLTMIINADKYGREESFQQKVEGRLLPTKLSKDDIIHLRFFPDLDSPYGISLLEASKLSIDRMRDVDESLFNAVQRHGGPKFWVQVGTEEEIPPKAVFDKIKTDLEDISSKNEFITPGVIKISTIDERGVPGVEAYADTFLKKTLVGLMCSQEALGLQTGTGSDAMANQRSLMFERFIKTLQHKMSTKLRVELINQILVENGFDENIVFMVFNSVTDADEEAKAKWIGNLFRGFPEGKKPMSINEIRARFSLPPIKGGDDLITGDVGTPAIQPPD